MSEEEAPTSTDATLVTKDDAPMTPPRNEDATESDEKLEEKKEGPNENAMTPVQTNANSSLSTPVREATELLPPAKGISTPGRSRPGTPARDDDPITITPIPSRVDINISSNSEEQEEDKPCPKWSDVLRTPATGEKFSPSKPLNKPGSLHGLGLMVATDRAKKLSQSGRRCAVLLSDIAGLEETFAQSLLKASLNANASSSPIAKTLAGVNRSRISFAKQVQGLAICIRGSVARPLHSTMASLGDTTPSIYQRYAATRVSCANARQAALRVRMKYVKAVKEAEAGIRELRQQAKQAGDSPPPEISDAAADKSQANASLPVEQSPWEVKLRKYGVKNGVSTDRLVALLKHVQTLEAEYKKLVKEENHAVLQAQSMEVMALEAVQKLEEERLQFFVESMNRMLTAEKGALDNMVLSGDQESSGEHVPMKDMSPSQEKKPNDFFMKILKKDSADEEGVGLMEAATLGLPEDVGTLRDEVKSCIASRNSRGQVARGLSTLLEEIASAASVFASGLESRIGQEGYGDARSKIKTADPLSAVMKRSEGPNVGMHWDAIVATIGDTAASARQLAYDLRVIRQEKLDAFVLRVERECKTATEGDDARWKHLCEMARNESKAQLRYQEATSHFEKARDRVKSVDNEMAASEHSEGGKGKRMNSGVSRALGNVFSILPDGGEQAMQKMLSDDARLQIAKTTLKEADQKESKEKYALDAAIAAKAQSLKSYSTKADSLVFTFKKEDAAGWSDVGDIADNMLSSLDGFRSDRYNSIEKATGDATSHDAQLSDIAEWTARATTHIAKKAKKKRDQQSSALAEVDLGFVLKVELEESTTVYKLLFMDDSEQEESEPFTTATESTERSLASANSSPKSVEAPAVEASDLLDSPADHFQISALKKRLSSAEIEELSIPNDSQSEDGDKVGSDADRVSKGGNAENSLFLSHFWQNRDENEEPPTIIESFSCAYWPKEGEGHLSPLLHGRLFLTSDTMYFVGWGDKKIVLDLADVIKVTKATNLMGTIDNSLRVTYEIDDGESSYFFGSFAFRDNALHLLQRLSTVARSLRELNGPPKAVKSATSESSLPPVPHDQTLKKMEVVLSKKLKNVSIQRFYELIWSEGNDTDAKPFYGPWCEKMGSRKVTVSDWETADDQFVTQWCGEKYERRRQVTFEFTRTTHLYIGPPIAAVKQTHYCTVDGNDKCVLQMTVEMEGIPYADCFAVEVRWVARRVGGNDIHVEVGVFVDFKKSTMFAKKIRAGTLEETKPVHHKLFDSVKALCTAEGGEAAAGTEEEEVEEEVEVEGEPKIGPPGLLSTVKDAVMENKVFLIAGIALFVLLRLATRFVGRGTSASATEIALLHERIDDLYGEMREMRQTLDTILQVLKEEKLDDTCGSFS